MYETKDIKSAPIHVYKRLKNCLTGIDLLQDDQIWFMVDKDRWPDEQLSYVCSHAIKGRKKVKLAISNPCFELWLYLHFDSWNNGACSSKDMEKSLRQRLGSYNKSNLDINKFFNRIIEAIDRARLLDTNPNNR